MRHHSAMSEIAPINGASTACSAARCSGISERILLTAALCALVHAGRALAGDHASIADEPVKQDSRQPPPVVSLTSLFSTDRSFADSDAFSATEFRPRSRGLAAADSSAGGRFGGDTPTLHGTTVWDRMADFRSQDRVRVLTLFETRGSSISLQAGKRGGPSLQWSNRRMNGDGATQGLLDRLVSAALRSPEHAGALRSVPAPSTLKPLSLSAAAGAQ